jgi:hypothetical protein
VTVGLLPVRGGLRPVRIAQLAQSLRQLLIPTLLGAGMGVLTLFDVADPVVENLPQQPG